jgi:hypothetical protein
MILSRKKDTHLSLQFNITANIDQEDPVSELYQTTDNITLVESVIV